MTNGGPCEHSNVPVLCSNPEDLRSEYLCCIKPAANCRLFKEDIAPSLYNSGVVIKCTIMVVVCSSFS